MGDEYLHLIKRGASGFSLEQASEAASSGGSDEYQVGPKCSDASASYENLRAVMMDDKATPEDVQAANVAFEKAQLEATAAVEAALLAASAKLAP
mmetsp:Transcript_49246/g.76897  ORF Transcript_49246/g.76897 Transcript_49246/m.76897 type:complete len:95 (-) Transcript_49246:116-400(-)